MTSFNLNVYFALAAVSGVIVLLVVVVRVSPWGWQSFQSCPEALDGSRETTQTLQREIEDLTRRLEDLDQTGGSGTWLASILVWHHHRKRRELEARRLALIEKQRRWTRDAERIRLPGSSMPVRSTAVRTQSQAGPEDGIRQQR